MHPHINCPMCMINKAAYPTTSVVGTTHEELTMFLINNAHARNWQDVATKFMKHYIVTKRDSDVV